jgi:hypothetical protein
MENRKAHLKQAQQRHLASLFSNDEAQRPAAQQADDHAAARARRLAKAADTKKASLTTEERQRLEELKQRSTAAAKAQPATENRATPQPPPQSQPPAGKQAQSEEDTLAELSALSDRNDLASAALRNMREHAHRAKQQPAQPRPATPSSAASQQAVSSAPPRSTDPQETRAPNVPPRQTGSSKPPRRPAPSPEELDALLKRMASRAQRGGERAGGPEAVESGPPTAEAPPPPPDVDVEKDRERQVELVEQLRAKESRLRETIKPIEQITDTQELAEEKPVEATVPIRVDSNAVSSGPLHDAIVKLQAAQRAHDARGQVDGANDVQRNIPGHPLYQEPS